MATNRKTPQWSIPLKPDVQDLLDEVIRLTDRPKSSVLIEALRLGLREMIAKNGGLPQHNSQVSLDVVKAAIVELLIEQQATQKPQ